MNSSVTVRVKGGTSQIEGKLTRPMLDAITEVTAYYKSGYQFSNRFRSGVWDGRIRLFRNYGKSFPSGLLNDVVGALKDEGVRVSVEDQRDMPSVPPIPPLGECTLEGINFEYPYDYQLGVMKKAIEAQRGILHIATNGGKCLGRGTMVLRYDGTRVPVEAVQVGDLLMGPDSEPRRVLSQTQDSGPLYLIEPKKGEPWVCNDVHVLTLAHTVTGKIIDVPLNEYLAQHKTFKHCHKQFMVGVHFPEQVPLPIDPYFLGVWFGDGGKDLENGVRVSKPDLEILETLQEIAVCYDAEVKTDNSKSCPTHRVVTPRGKINPLLNHLRDVVFHPFADKQIHIPHQYLTASWDDRAAFLAGYIDTDGYAHSNSVEITQKRKDFADAIWFIARSLGLRALRSEKPVSGYGIYHRVSITGDFSGIPIRIKRKIPSERRRKTDPCRTGINVTPLGEGTYYGFTLDGDGRFLLGDFTVTHNTEIACLIAQCLRLPTLFLVPGKDLLSQTADRFMHRLGLDNKEVGVIGDGKWQVGDWITVATVASLHANLKKIKCQDLLDQTQLMFADECHMAGSDTWFEVMKGCNAFFRFGMSGTPLNRTDGADLRLVSVTGPVITQIRNKYLIERGISCEVEVWMLPVRVPLGIDPKTPYNDAYDMGIVENTWRNHAIDVLNTHFAKQGLQSIILIRKIDHGKELDKGLWKTSSLPHQFICGKEPTPVRKQALKDFKRGDLQSVISTKILNQGIDVPCIDVLFMGGGGESSIETLQKVGRGIRIGGNSNKLIVVDFADFTNRHLLKHSLQRLKDYRAEECFTIKQIDLEDYC